MFLIRAYREEYILKINSRACTVIRDIRLGDFLYINQCWMFSKGKFQIGHGNSDHATSYKIGDLERFATKYSKPDLDRLLDKALPAPPFGGGCETLIIVPYSTISYNFLQLLDMLLYLMNSDWSISRFVLIIFFLEILFGQKYCLYRLPNVDINIYLKSFHSL